MLTCQCNCLHRLRGWPGAHVSKMFGFRSLVCEFKMLRHAVVSRRVVVPFVLCLVAASDGVFYRCRIGKRVVWNEARVCCREEQKESVNSPA